MLRALNDADWNNYSIFVRDDGLLIGYFETADLAAAQAAMAATEVNARWQAEMAEFFEDLGEQAPDTGFVVLDEIFNLEEQLAAHRAVDGIPISSTQNRTTP
jgi:L-rhamnose mutarotase